MHPAAITPKATPQPATAPWATDKVREPHCWFDPAVRYPLFPDTILPRATLLGATPQLVSRR